MHAAQLTLKAKQKINHKWHYCLLILCTYMESAVHMTIRLLLQFYDILVFLSWYTVIQRSYIYHTKITEQHTVT